MSLELYKNATIVFCNEIDLERKKRVMKIKKHYPISTVSTCACVYYEAAAK